MRVLFAIKSLNVAGGGAERVLVDIANGLADRGHSVQILTFDDPGESFYFLGSAIRRIDTGIGRPGQPTSRLGILTAVPKVRRLVRAAEPDVVVAFMHSTYVLVAASLMGTAIPLVVSEHADQSHFRSRPLQRFLAGMAHRLSRVKTVPTGAAWRSSGRWSRSKVQVLPNPVSLTGRTCTVENEPTSPPVLLSVGRLMHEKNHIDLIRAFARVADSFPSWMLKIVGDGELRERLEHEVSSLGLTGRVFMPGATRDVMAEYASASVIAIPSLYESFGLVAAEALSCGRPVIAFDCCAGVMEMIQSEVNGLAVSAAGDRVSNLAEGLARLMQDNALRERLGSAGPASVEQFTLPRVLDTWEQFLSRTTGTVGTSG